ncbi:hypothetical protein XU18_2389 [Perkinsela sp. CCAP 1560/4]|nr:hypothetical protein XU18_2389 [Perkinsela sp. CCAP 1560/4]|eukprot:KNH06787.1 hypothetical protein XU18_2389 [Perkinsela sp. CCAP 1560/4]
MGRLPALCVLWNKWLNDIAWPTQEAILTAQKRSKFPMCVQIEGVKFRTNVALLARCALYFQNTVFHLRTTSLLNDRLKDMIRYMSSFRTLLPNCLKQPGKFQKKILRLVGRRESRSSTEGNSTPYEFSILTRHNIPRHILQSQLIHSRESDAPSGIPLRSCACTSDTVTSILLSPPVPTRSNAESLSSSNEDRVVSKPLEEFLQDSFRERTKQGACESFQVLLSDENGFSSCFQHGKKHHLTHIPMFGSHTNESGNSSGSLNMVSALAITLFRVQCVHNQWLRGTNNPSTPLTLVKDTRIHAVFSKSSSDWDPGFAAIIRNCYHMGVHALHVIAPKFSHGNQISRHDRKFNPRGAVGCEHRLPIYFYLYIADTERADAPLTYHTSGNVQYAFLQTMSNCIHALKENVRFNPTDSIEFWALETDYPILTSADTLLNGTVAKQEVNLCSPSSIATALQKGPNNIVLCIPEEGHFLPTKVLQECSKVISKGDLAEPECQKNNSRGLGNVLTSAIALYTLRTFLEGKLVGCCYFTRFLIETTYISYHSIGSFSCVNMSENAK